MEFAWLKRPVGHFMNFQTIEYTHDQNKRRTAHIVEQQGFSFGGSVSFSGGLLSNNLFVSMTSLGVNSSFVVRLLIFMAFCYCLEAA